MPCERITTPSVYSLLKREEALVAGAVEERRVVTLIVGDHELEESRKIRFCDICPMGVDIQTYAHWIGGMWDLYGDGRELVKPPQRHVLLRPLLTELAELEPSSDYVDMLAAFAVDCIAVGAEDVRGLSPTTAALVRTVEAYQGVLKAHGLVEAAAVEQDLARYLAGRTIIFEEPDLTHARMRRVIEAFAEFADVYVLERGIGDGKYADAENELTALRNRLFSGMEGLEPQGRFIAAEAHGAHAEPELVIDLVERLKGEGHGTGEIAVALPDPSEAYPRMLDALAVAQIPFECAFSLAAGQTPFGEAFLAIKHMRDPEFAESFDEVATFVASPYAGLGEDHARAFQAEWRSQAGSTPAERIENLRSGLKRREPKSGWGLALMRIVNLLEARDLRQCAELMFANAQAAGVGPDRLKDDASCCDAIIDHLIVCDELGLEPHDHDLAALPVRLVRTAGPLDAAVRVTTPGRISKAACVIMGRLDQDTYSMAAKPLPFDGALAEIGAPVELDLAQCCRIDLLTGISAAVRVFAAYRVCHDREGNEKCQSALWDELMQAYRTTADEERAINEIPQALEEGGYAVRLSEDEAFARLAADAPGFEARRGRVEGEESLARLVPNYDERRETFSPTALEDYHRCPYRWFIARRIGARPLDESFDQLAKGNLAHEMLKRIYEDFAQEGIERVTEDNLLQAYGLARETCVNTINSEIERKRLFLTNERELAEAEEIVDQVLDLVKRDAYFLPGFTPRYHELVLEGPDKTPLEYAGVKVRGKVDRIDVDEQGNAIVIDYKLSSLKSGYGLKEDEELPDRIQTDIYALLVQRHFEARGEQIKVIGSVYRSYAANNLRGVFAQGVEWGDVENVRPDTDALPGGASAMSYEDYLGNVEDEVAKHIERLRAGDIAPTPRCKEACMYCLAEDFCPERRG